MHSAESTDRPPEIINKVLNEVNEVNKVNKVNKVPSGRQGSKRSDSINILKISLVPGFACPEWSQVRGLLDPNFLGLDTPLHRLPRQVRVHGHTLSYCRGLGTIHHKRRARELDRQFAVALLFSLLGILSRPVSKMHFQSILQNRNRIEVESNQELLLYFDSEV